MKGRVAILALLALVLAAPVRSAAAEAVPLLPPLPPPQLMTQVGAPVAPAQSFRSGFVIEASEGYKVGVMSFGSAVILVVFRGGHGKGLTETAYLARGVVAPERLQATFGSFGKVSMRFRQSKNRTWSGKRRDCRGADRFVKRRGVFIGSLEFRGEDGYVSVDVNRAKGAVVTPAAKCLPRQKPAPPRAQSSSIFDEPSPALFATSWNGVDKTSFLALELKEKTASLVIDEETRGKLAIVRIALARKPGPLSVNEAATSAHLSPPAPFHGTGHYAAAPDGSTTWTGDLTVDFPDRPRFPLTGPQFEVLLEAPF
jgi:hypothetical protein